MYKVKIISNFSGAHSLRDYKGKCESLHGHNWRVEVSALDSELNSSGMVMDFSELKRITNEIIDDLDHKHLNDLDYFKKNNPSSEEIARYLYTKIKENLPKNGPILDEVSIWETDTSCATYRE